MRFLKRFIFPCVLFLYTGMAWAGSLAPDLRGRVATAGPLERFKVIVCLNWEADLSSFARDDRQGMVRRLRAFAAESQKGILTALPGYGDRVARVRGFWIYNGIAMEATKDVILDLLKRPEVATIEEDKAVRLEPMSRGGNTPGFGVLEWNIRKIQADSVWSVLGYTGEGIVVGNIDSGVLTTHETFGGRYRGGSNSWFDAVYGRAEPYDDNGHGTYTMGVTCGGSAWDTIGVARGARFVCAKAFNAGGEGYYSWVDACFEWLAGLGSAAPNVVGNSWGASGAETHFWQESRTLEVLGIHQVCSIGNSGPGYGTVLAPGSYPHLVGVGASDSTDGLAGFSSRGPAPVFGAMESTANYLDPAWGSSRRKPDLSAPGVAVRSSFNDGEYVTAQGTSISAPHVTGTIALMLQKNDQLADTTIWRILTQSCDTPEAWGPYPNQDYGWGRLNAYRAVQMTPSGYPHFQVWDQGAETLLVNTSVVDTVTVISMNGFSSPVNMVLDSIRPQAPTIWVSFKPNPVTPPPNGKITTGMRITVQPGTPNQDYVIYFHGAGDTIIRRASVDLKVEGPGFELGCDSLVFVAPGDTVLDSVTVTSEYGFSSPVTMTPDSIRPAEPTISVVFNPNPVTPPPNGSIATGMEIATQTGTPPGNYRIFFHGRGDTLVRVSAVHLKVYGPSFDLRYSQNYTMATGDTVQDSVSIMSRYNFNYPVTLALDSIRPIYYQNNFSVNYNPNPVTPPPNDSVRTQIRIIASVYASEGVRYLYCHGAGGGVTKPFVIYIHTVPTTFLMGQTANADTLIPNSSVVDSVSLTESGYVIWQVTLALDSIRPAEPAISVDFNPNPVWIQGYGAFKTSRRITAQAGTPSGDYKVYYQGTGGNISRYLAVSLKVVSQPFGVSSMPGNKMVHQWCSSVDYKLSMNAFVSYPLTCTLSAAVDPSAPSLGVSILGDSILSRGDSCTLRVKPGPETEPGTYLIKVQARSGEAVYTLEDTLVYAVSYFLGQASPNPSHGSVTIPYGLPVEAPLSIEVYDIAGRRVRVLASGRGKVGYQKVSWDGRADGGGQVPTGVYLYRLKAGNWAKTGKMVVVR